MAHPQEESLAMESNKEFMLDDESVYVMMFRSLKSLIVEMITEDQEALGLTELALRKWFTEKGLSTTTDSGGKA